MIIWGCSPRGLYNMGVFFGKAKGIFKLPGVECSLFENITGSDYTNEIIKERFDMGTCGTPPLFAALDKTNEYALVGTANYKYPPFYLMGNQSVQKISDLKGKSIGINKKRTCLESVLNSVLNEHGLADTGIQTLELVTPKRYLEAIKQNDIQAAVLWEPWVSFLERAYKWKVIVDYSELNKLNYAYFIYAKKSLIQEKRDVVKGLVEAYGKSIEYAKSHLYELMDFDYPMELVDKIDVQAALKREVPRWNTNTKFDSTVAIEAQKELLQQGVISESFSYTDYLIDI